MLSLLGWVVGSMLGYLLPGRRVSLVKARPPLEVHAGAPLDGQASGFELAGMQEAPVVATIQRGPKGR